LEDKHGRSAGNIDIVLVAYDSHGHVTDFGSLEMQAVYISGNIRRPFEHYMEHPRSRKDMDWSRQTTSTHYPTPDYLSSSRKRLLPQMLYKGGILSSWGKKQAVVIQKSFFDTLPDLPRVQADKAQIAWFLYDLQRAKGVYNLACIETVYTEYSPALERITTPEPGNLLDFVRVLQDKLNDHMESPPDAPTLAEASLQ